MADPVPGDAGAFVLIGGATALYGPSAAGGTALFLLGATASPPARLALADLWSDDGPPANPGWFVFLDAPVGPGGAAALETSLRAQLIAGTMTGLAWARATGPVFCALGTASGAAGHPAVAADMTIPTPAGMLALSLAGDAPMRRVSGPGAAEAISCGVPPGAGAASGTGCAMAIQGADAGCIRFPAFIGDAPGPGASTTLMAISIDPLRPFDPARSYERYTGRTFGFASNGAGWQLVALGETEA